MKITICASVAFLDKIIKAREELYTCGCDVKVPLPEEDRFSSGVATTDRFNVMKDHLDSILHSDAILVLNYDKDGVEGYIGPNTLIEIGVAFFLKKKIFVLNSLPDLPLKEEIEAMEPVMLGGKLSNIMKHLK